MEDLVLIFNMKKYLKKKTDEKITKKKKKKKKLKEDVNELLKNVSIPKGLEIRKY